MPETGSAATRALIGFLKAETGLPKAIEEISLREGTAVFPEFDLSVLDINVPPDLAERDRPTRYPSLVVYCDKVVNDRREKFTRFSGYAQLVIQVRLSQERLNGFQRRLQLMVEALTDVLEGIRGDWGGGMHYSGAYEITYGQVKHGGRHFLHTGTISLPVNIHHS